MLPMFRWEVIKGHQHVTVLVQTVTRLFVFGLVFFQEGIESPVGVLPCIGEPDLVEVRLRSWLHALGHFVENVGSLVNLSLIHI